MYNYQHILIASNLSEDSKHVAARAKNIAEHSDAKLSIIHVIEPNPLIYGGGEFAIPVEESLRENIEKEARQKLDKQSEQLGIPSEQRWVKYSFTTQGIIDLVKEIQVDLIVAGSHDQHGIELLFGSTAISLLHEMPCDILAVRV